MYYGYSLEELASVAQLDACPTGDQEVAGSTPVGSATFFHGDLIMKFSTVILSVPLIQDGQLSVSGEECAHYWTEPAQ